jgi:hypothetical protein
MAKDAGEIEYRVYDSVVKKVCRHLGYKYRATKIIQTGLRKRR